MYLICGLGNPGPKYELTRHNIGFMVADELARRHSQHFRSGRGNYLYCNHSINGESLILLKPMTYMNLSGEALRHAADYWNIDQAEILVVTDDYHIPFGQIRLRQSGRDGGHNGLGSVINCLHSNAVPRLRMGIGPDHPIDDAANFVLARFTSEEKKSLEEFTNLGADAAEDWLENGIIHAMNRFNQK